VTEYCILRQKNAQLNVPSVQVFNSYSKSVGSSAHYADKHAIVGQLRRSSGQGYPTMALAKETTASILQTKFILTGNGPSFTRKHLSNFTVL